MIKSEKKHLSKKEIAEFITIFCELRVFTENLKSRVKFLTGIQNPKIPPSVSESLIIHLINDKIILKDLAGCRLGGGRINSDVYGLPSKGKEIQIEVKATTSETYFQSISSKDKNADYLIWIDLKDFIKGTTDFIDVYIIEPTKTSKIKTDNKFNMKQTLGMENKPEQINLKEYLSGL